MTAFAWNLIHLKYFRDAVQFGGISASARKNCVSQSAISQAIVKLEQQLDCKLIDHRPNRFKLTDEGKKLFESSQTIFSAIQRTEEAFSQDSQGMVEFACTHSFSLALLPFVLKRAQKLYPSLQIKFRLAHAYTIMEWVRKGIVDFGILIDNVDLSAFHCEEIYRGRWHTFVSKKSKNVKKLSFLLDSEERTETNLLKKSYKTRFGKELPILMEISSWETIANLTGQGLGIGLFPDYLLKRYPNLKPYPENLLSLPYKIYALFARNTVRSKHVQRFLDILTSSIN